MIDFEAMVDFDGEDFIMAFKASRNEAQNDAIERLRPFVEAWLADFGNRELRDAFATAIEDVWIGAFTEQTRRAGYRGELRRFREMVGESLSLTSAPTDPAEGAQIERIATWGAVVGINSGAHAGFQASGVSRIRWLTMNDDAVRGTHRAANGSTADIGGTFDIGGYDLHYPGEPVGPPDIWINCRCVIAPAGRRRGRVNSADVITAAIEDREPDDELPEDIDIEGETLDDVPDEIPVHGVATVEGVPTGDNRMFRDGALTHRDLPLPLRYEFVGTHGGDTSEVAVIGRIDEMWREGNEYRYRGVIFPGKRYGGEAIEGIIDGSLTGVSVEVDNVILADDGNDDEHDFRDNADAALTVFSDARVCGFTIVPIPAYAEAYISLGPDFLEDLDEESVEALRSCGCLGGGTDDYREVSDEERKRLADEGKALPDGSFPIANVEDLENAIQAIGRAKDRDAAIAHIKKRARELDREDLIPEEWNDEDAMTASVNITDEHGAPIVYAPGTKDGPGWVTHPRATARIRRYWVRGKGAAKIRWGAPGDFNRCRRQLMKYVKNPNWLAGLCANMHKEALGIWPGQHRGHLGLAASGAPAELFTLVASAKRPWAPAEYFEMEEPDQITPLTVNLETGQVYGHAAQYDVCHIGIPGACTVAPKSATNYAYFRTGAFHADGKEIAVGQITMDTGHADARASAHAAASHYDDTGKVVADITAKDGKYGIWVSGALRPDVDEATARRLAASQLSGDWRRIGGNLELVGLLAVNVPGFPIPRMALAASADGQTALIAAGMVERPEPEAPKITVTPADVAAITRNAIAEYRHQEERERRLAAVRPVREAIRKERIEAARARVEGM